MTYFTTEQVAQLLRPINGKRVSQDGKGFSHVEAYEIKAHLNRVVGFARWSADLLDTRCVFEDGQAKTGKNGSYVAWTVCYLATMRLTVCAPDGTVLATYTEAATGEAKNQPSRGDAHDLAVKTAESQALKRCSINLGDNYGLSLYCKGSQSALVRKTLVTPDTAAAEAEQAVDAHITEQLPREDEAAEPTADPRVTNAPSAIPPSGVEGEGSAAAVTPAAAAEPTTEALEAAEQRRQARADELRGQMQHVVENGPPAGQTINKYLAHLTGVAMKEKLHTVQVESLISPNQVPLRLFIEECLKAATARPTADRRAG